MIVTALVGIAVLCAVATMFVHAVTVSASTPELRDRRSRRRAARIRSGQATIPHRATSAALRARAGAHDPEMAA